MIVQLTNVDKQVEMLAYEGVEVAKLLRVWIEETYGERCRDFEELCPNCKAWESYDKVLKVVEGVK